MPGSPAHPHAAHRHQHRHRLMRDRAEQRHRKKAMDDQQDRPKGRLRM